MDPSKQTAPPPYPTQPGAGGAAPYPPSGPVGGGFVPPPSDPYAGAGVYPPQPVSGHLLVVFSACGGIRVLTAYFPVLA